MAYILALAPLETSCSFLSALPCSSLGTRMDNIFLRLAIALLLLTSISSNNTCICGPKADSYGMHALVCRRILSQICCNLVNDLIYRASGSSMRLKPPGHNGPTVKIWSGISHVLIL